ncbi:MAG: hypothetical protein ACW97P_12720, partial [Candidatus Hodarchaeales archaeon]
KDKHSAVLTNKMFDAFKHLEDNFKRIRVVIGNHDYINPQIPFFGFLGTCLPFGQTVVASMPLYLFDEETLLIPHQRDLEMFSHLKVKGCFEKFKYIFMHQTLYGALTSSGVTLEGEDTLKPDFFKDTDSLLISGDIHVPQKVGKVIYCGSPYTIRFNDTFTPRVLLVDGKKLTDLHYPTIKKCTVVIKQAKDLQDPKHGLKSGDQVKVRLRLNSNELLDWSKYKREVSDVCKELDVDLYGVELYKRKRERFVAQEQRDESNRNSSDEDVFNTYCSKEKVNDWLKELGSKIIAGTSET